MKEDKFKIFCDCAGAHEVERAHMCVDPEMVIKALHDAKDEMSYSNWHNDKFDRAIKLVKAYAMDKQIVFDFNK